MSTGPIPRTMRAFAVDRFGEVGKVREVPVPSVGPDELLVRVLAAGVNPLDLKIRDGGKIAEDVSFPLVLGQDASGVVAQVGPGVIQFGAGAEIFGAFWICGTFAEYVRVPLNRSAITYKPAKLDFLQAAALPTAALAAHAAICAAKLTGGNTVLLIGATGSVGSFLVQMAARHCEKVIATARTDAEEYVRKLGASQVIDYTKRDIWSTVRSEHPDGIDAIIDVVSSRDTLNRFAELLRPGGRLVSTIHNADVDSLSKAGLCPTNIDVFKSRMGMDEVASTVSDFNISIPIARTYPLAAAADALTAVKDGHTLGKILLTIP